MALLFRLAQWHSLAKLRMHNDSTLTVLEKVTQVLGRDLRGFRDTLCQAFKTVELGSEVAARNRRTGRSAKSQGLQTSSGSHTTTAREKTFNLSTYKFHALGDYVTTIRNFGTTDSYTTQIVCVHPCHELHTS
jgi:hypothetical protein